MSPNSTQTPKKPAAGQVEQDSPANGRDERPMTQEEASKPPSETPAYPARGA